MKEYTGLVVVSWVLRATGVIVALIGLIAAAIALTATSAKGEAAGGLLAMMMAAAPFAGGVVMYAIGDAMAALADIARNTARTAQAAESLSGMIGGQIANQRASMTMAAQR